MSSIKPAETPADFLTSQRGVELDLADKVGPSQFRRRQVERAVRHHIVTLVRALRKSSQLTQVEAGDAWGDVNQGQVSRFEADPGNARLATVLSYLDALGAETELRTRFNDQRAVIRVIDGHVTFHTDEPPAR